MGADSEGYNAKLDSFLPSQRFNLSQFPIPFVLDLKKRTNGIIKPGDKHQKKCLGKPASGLEKRQCTLQGCMRADGKHPRIALILRVKPKECVQTKK